MYLSENGIQKILYLTSILLMIVFGTACTSLLKEQVVDSFLEEITAEDSALFAGEEDPQLVRESLPVMIKFNEALIGRYPKSQRLRLQAAKLYTSYAALWLEVDAVQIEDEQFEAAKELRERASLYYLRAKNEGLNGLAIRYPEVSAIGTNSFPERWSKEDLPLLVWTGLSWAGWIQLNSDKPEILEQVPQVLNLLESAIKIDETYEQGMVHEFFIYYYGRQAHQNEASLKKATEHFERVVALTKGEKCSPYLAYANAVKKNLQDREGYLSLLELALSQKVTQNKAFKLVNVICQKQVYWYKNRVDDLFL